METLELLTSIDWTAVISIAIAVASVITAIIQAYQKNGLAGAITAINDFFTMHNVSTTSAPPELQVQTYTMEQETLESVISLCKDEEVVSTKSKINANQESGIVSYTLDLQDWFIKVDYGQITQLVRRE